jgi:hypothetical protein
MEVLHFGVGLLSIHGKSLIYILFHVDLLFQVSSHGMDIVSNLCFFVQSKP